MIYTTAIYYLNKVKDAWREMLIGAIIGWIVSILIGAPMLVILEFNTSISTPTLNYIAFAWTYACIGVGAIVGYSRRREDGNRNAKGIETNS
jgi:Mg/Co/Ni transporter MgtE